MKKCPSCNQLFTDDNMFCPNDGTTLLYATETGANLPVFPTADNQTTQIISQPQFVAPNVAAPAVAPSNDSSKWLFLVIGILATALVGLGAFMFVSRGEKEEKKDVAAQTAKTGNVAENTNPAEDKTVKTTPKPVQSVQPQTNPNLNPAGSWSGDWNSTGSYRTFFTAQMDLTDEGGGKVSGSIVWNLQSTNNPKKTDKVGTSATEYVQGTYNPATRALALRGVSKDDPYNIVILDRYNLTLAENNLMLNGRSKGGNLRLKR